MQYKAISLPPEDSQFLSTRQFGVNEICRIFRVPPHMVQDLEHATFSNIEHQSIDFVVHTLTPWLVRFEQAIVKDLLLPEEQDEYFPKFNVDGLLRTGSFAATTNPGCRATPPASATAFYLRMISTALRTWISFRQKRAETTIT